MCTLHRVEERRTRLGSPPERESRLPLAQAAAVIAGLSVLSWAVLIAIVMGLRAVL